MEEYMKQFREENLELYSHLLEYSRSIFLEWDTDGRILYMNNFGLELFGYEADELMGKNVLGTIVQEVSDEGQLLSEKMQHVQARPDDYYSSENENVKKNGEKVWIVWTNKGIYDSEGKLERTVSIGIDRTMQHQAEQELAKHKEKLEEIIVARTSELNEIIAGLWRRKNC